MPLKRTIVKPWAILVWVAFAALALLTSAQATFAAPCDIRPNAPSFVQHDLTNSYCELCGYGYVSITVSNPLEDSDMLRVVVTADLRNSGLTYDPTAPDPVTYTYVSNGVTNGPISGGAPTPSGANNSILTWTFAQIPDLAVIEYRDQSFRFDSVTITFAVTRDASLSQEGLIGADRNIQASISYLSSNTEPNCPEDDTFRTSVSSTLDTLPLREPNPVVRKRGRNVDAGQGGGSWTTTVYGHVNDDIIWRIEVDNDAGTAPLQDLRFDDLMQDGSLDINYACPTYASASDITSNNGILPGGSLCVASSNAIDNFDVDNPFGEPGSDVSDEVDVPEPGSAYIYLVGKIRPDTDGSCTTQRTNTVSEIQWGCEDDAPAGGIFQTSTGESPESSTTTLYTLYGERNPLLIDRRLTGVNTSQPVGSRGTMTIRIRNYSGGSVRNIVLTDALPAEYVMDPTFTPTVRMNPRYGTYDGMIDNITWDNEDTSNPLNNTTPIFTLTSDGCSIGPCDDTVHPFYSDQRDMMRDGDILTIVFRVVLIETEHYDKVADIDVREEVVADGTDPDNQTTLANTLTVDFDTFCSTQPHYTFTLTGNGTATSGSAIPAFPEDLDIDIESTGDLVFILTDDPAQRLPLTVNLTNNGGHDAEDYTAYVTFGQTMAVVTAPSACSLTSNPPPHDEWQDPDPIPAGAAIYACTGGVIAPGQTVDYDFEVIKSSATADIDADDLTFRADVVGEIHLYDGTLLTFPTPLNPPDPGARPDGGTDIGNNYSLDAIRARVIGFNLLKSQVGNCSENNDPAPALPDLEVQIGEECSYHIEAGGWFGFETPGFILIAVQDVTLYDQLPNGQGYISSTNPVTTSTSGILGVSLNPPPVAPNEVTAPEYMNWTFNFGEPQRITERGHWFRADMTSRLLNDPIDTSAAPNEHAAPSTNVLLSTFVGVFHREGEPTADVFNLDHSTVGYPREEVRRVSLTVTEPDITIVKEVCNEDIYGVGPSCSNFVPLTDEGDAYNSYIYRITLTNEQESDGVTRAPAYDVTVTDALDPSDLALVMAFGSDGLDNDGDGVTDEADEGTISDNIVRNGTPAQITFDYTHSTALERINPGAANSVQLYYRVDYDDDAAPLQVFTNTAGATYDSLEGPSGSQTVIQCVNSEACGARFYTTAATAASVQIVPVLTRPKEIIALSNTPAAMADPQPVVIGEEVRYRLTTSLPVALFRNFVIRDELPAGIRCVDAPAVDLNALPAGFQPGGVITPTCTDSLVEWVLGDQRITVGSVGTRYDFEVEFIARVENTADTNDADVISNGNPATAASASYIDEGGNAISLSYDQVDIQITEPLIALTKTFAVANADADDILTVTVTATNTGTATAYNLRVYDNLDGLNLTYIGNVGGSNPPDFVDTTTFGANQPVFGWSAPNGIDVGASVSFTFEIQVDDVVQPHEILDNTIQADWTSLPGQSTALNGTGQIGANGSETGMRIGAIPNAGDAINDYETTAAAQATVPALTVDKTDQNPANVPAIGQRKLFQLDISLPEGVTNGVIATDSLDAAGISYVLENNATYDITYTFQGIATINGAVPAETAFNAFPADGATGTITWNIGNVVTQTEDDASTTTVNPLIRVRYYARVNNDLVTDDGDALQNSVVVNYTNGESGAQETLADAAPANTVVEPLLVPTKTVTNATLGKDPDDPPAGGDILQYVIAVLNNGTSTAYDVNIVDTIPANLSLNGSYTPTATIGGIVVAGFITDPANSPNGPLIWGRDNGDESLDIPAGQSLVITYQAVLDLAGGSIANSAMVDWTSLDGPSDDERDGEGCPAWTAPDDYCAGPASATTPTVDINNVAKTVTGDSFDTAPWSTAGDAIARIGDFITYRLDLNLSGGLTRNLVVQDTLPAGMAFVETVSINGDTTPSYTPPGSGAGSNFSYSAIASANVPVAGQTGALTWTIGDVVNDPFGDATTDAITIIYRARILPDAGIAQVDTTTLTNNVSMTYETATGAAPAQTASATITVVQPILSVIKSGDPAGGDTVLAAGEIVEYTVDITNTGDAPAYDPQLTDILPVGMRNGAATVTTVSMVLLSAPGSPLANVTPAYDATTGVVTWEYDTGVADQYTIPAGDTLRIVYQVQTDETLAAGMTLTNQAQVQHYYSLDDEAIPSYGGTDGAAQAYGPSNAASVTFTTSDPVAPDKQNPAELNVAIGEPFTYRIVVPVTPLETALNDVRIVDDLSLSAADLRFVSVTRISGSQPWTPVNTGTDTNIVIEDTTIGIDIPAGEQIVVDITVILEDTATNASGLNFNNTADYTYNQVDADDATQTAGGSDTTEDMTIVGPDTGTLEKDGPAVVQLETPGTYTLDFHNTGTGTAWNPTITDRIPNEADGGMCAAGPINVTAQIFEADGTTPYSPVLVENTDFAVQFDGDPTCEWRFNLLSAAGGVPADHRLIITYDLALDPDTLNGISLTNVAGATQWYGADPNEANAAPHVYQHEISTTNPGTPGILDLEDAHTITAEAPILQFDMSVANATTGQDPGTDASPGDTLIYTIQITNTGPVGISAFTLTDELDALNTTMPLFEPGTLTILSTPAGADTTGTSGTGGANGTGVLNITNLTIGAQGEADDSITIQFQATLVPVIDSGTVVHNQAQIVTANPTPFVSDDPNQPGDADYTDTLITSASQFQVLKSSTILEGDPEILMAGERLRYTITIQNIGNENALNVYLRDYIPANTSYVENSTTLNGVPVPDATAGVSPLQDGMPVNAPENSTPGYMRADDTPGGTNIATITFDVIVDPDVMDGLIIENQGFVGGDGAGSGDLPEQPSDDPNTPIPDDPTQNIVGNLPYLYALKTVEISQDFGSPGLLDPGDVLRYTFTITNYGAIPATNVVLTDAIPNNTTYVADSLRLNGVALTPDGGVFPLVDGVLLQSSDNPGDGNITPEESALVIFETTVDAGTPVGTQIRNQGSVTSTELPPEPTDSDGIPSNGDQATVIVVGDAQLVTITKEVYVVGEGPALAGTQLEYVIRVTNVGTVPATSVIVVDQLNLAPLVNQVSYVAGSGTLNGSTAGVDYSGGILTIDYGAQAGDLPAGEDFVVRFRVLIDENLPIGTTITNTGDVQWSTPAQTASASVSIDVGGTPDTATLNGTVWHDVNFNGMDDTDPANPETLMAGWLVELYYNSQLVSTTETDASGNYTFTGLLPNLSSTSMYEIQFHAPDAGPNTASMGYADSSFTNGPQHITEIAAAEGSNLQDLNLPLWPNGAIYNSVARTPVAGATVSLLNAATSTALPTACFDDPVQQGQITLANGFYKFDLNFSDTACPAGGAYLIEVTSPAAGYLAAPSIIIPPASDATTAPFSVPDCPGTGVDADPSTAAFCEATTFEAVYPVVPRLTVEPRSIGTTYYLHLIFNNRSVPGHSQIFYNPIPIDPVLDGAVAITKTTPLINVTRSDLVPYTITVTNIYGFPLYDIAIMDQIPPGFKYVAGSARMDGSSSEPAVTGRQLVWDNLELDVNQVRTLKMLLVVGAGVSEGEYVNQAWVRNTATGDDASGVATATVRVVPDPTFDCTDVIGKVFDDKNLNGRQDEGEKGLSGVRVVTARGLIATSDPHGRFHITCATVPDEDRGSNFILKLDDRSLPSGYRLTTENPRVQRATRGHMLRFNFGATIYRVVRMDIADGVFEPDSSEMRLQWTTRVDQLLSELLKAPSILRLSYLADVERKGLVNKRLKALKKEISEQWETLDGGYPLVIETEVFWRRGAPYDGD